MNLMRPVILAKSVSSLPRPTFRPGFTRVPRCRTMIVPPGTTCPPNALNPSRCAFESRPFLDVPCPFLCAIKPSSQWPVASRSYERKHFATNSYSSFISFFSLLFRGFLRCLLRSGFLLRGSFLGRRGFALFLARLGLRFLWFRSFLLE